MYQSGLVQDSKSVKKLCCKDADERRRQAAEGVLLDELVEVDGEELKDEAEMSVVDELIFEPQQVVLVRVVPCVVEQVKDGDLHHGLVVVGGLVLDDLDGNDFVRLHVLALDDLSKGTLTEKVEDEVSVDSTRTWSE